MSIEEPFATGAFTEALVDADHIRDFMEEQIRPLKAEEDDLAPPWRSGFRVRLPYFRLLDEHQQAHLRGIFAHMLPDPDVEVASFDREELILLDVLAETYIVQARVFSELMGDYEYGVLPAAHRDEPGRIIALTLSASVFVLDVPGRDRKRRYHYQNIYGNRYLSPEGRCRLKGNLRLTKGIRALEFRSSPLLMLALQTGVSRDRVDFRRESQMVSQTFTSRMREATFHASSRFHSYTDVRPVEDIGAGDGGGDDDPLGEPDDPDRPGDTN